MSNTKQIPDFKSEEERDFWENHDSSDYIDWSEAKTASMPDLKPSTKNISLRLPEASPTMTGLKKLIVKILLLWPQPQ